MRSVCVWCLLVYGLYSSLTRKIQEFHDLFAMEYLSYIVIMDVVTFCCLPQKQK